MKQVAGAASLSGVGNQWHQQSESETNHEAAKAKPHLGTASQMAVNRHTW